MVPQLGQEVRQYAVKELARRAGVSREFFQRWNIAVSEVETIVSIAPETRARIRFLHGPHAGTLYFLDNRIPLARAAWHPPGRVAPEPDLLLPFCYSDESSRPLYETLRDGSIVCRLDLLATLVLTLTRFEETLSNNFDEHGRFPAFKSLAAQNSFLHRPILDEHGRAFQDVLNSLLPAWEPEARNLRLKLTHDIDDIGIPFEPRTTLAHALKRRQPSAAARNLFATITEYEPAELSLVRKLATISKDRGLHSAFFWKGCTRTPHDSGYNVAHPKVQRVIHDLRKQGFELGVHPGYETFREREKLAEEVVKLKTALKVNSPGGRQHYLRWRPSTWLDWEACGLHYDSSVGYADEFGFRAGTAIPYRPWSWELNRELDLIEVPLILMDCTPVKYRRLNLEDGLSQIKLLIRRVSETGGVFTLLWHNTPLMEAEYVGWYEAILDLLTGAKNYEVPSDFAELW